MIENSKARITRWSPDGAPIFDLTQSLKEAIDAISNLDERIARFETGAAYERPGSDMDKIVSLAKEMVRGIDFNSGYQAKNIADQLLINDLSRRLLVIKQMVEEY